MTKQFRPLKAPSKGIPVDFYPKIKFPVLASPKYDGLRLLNRNGTPVTSALKPVRNRHTAKLTGIPQLLGMDGELVVGDGADPKGFSKATSAMMAEHGEYNIIWQVFDLQDIDHDIPFHKRFAELEQRVKNVNLPYVRLVPHTLIKDLEELRAYERDILNAGFEGAMIRSVNGRYKFDRSTMNEQILLKLKSGNEKRDDATIIGFVEQYENTNPPYINERGLQQRPTNKEGMIPKNTLGSFRVRDEDGREFNIGGGIEGTMDDAFRKDVWENREAWLGKVIRYVWFDYGGYELPRFPKYISVRAPEDISEDITHAQN